MRRSILFEHACRLESVMSVWVQSVYSMPIKCSKDIQSFALQIYQNRVDCLLCILLLWKRPNYKIDLLVPLVLRSQLQLSNCCHVPSQEFHS